MYLDLHKIFKVHLPMIPPQFRKSHILYCTDRIQEQLGRVCRTWPWSKIQYIHQVDEFELKKKGEEKYYLLPSRNNNKMGDWGTRSGWLHGKWFLVVLVRGNQMPRISATHLTVIGICLMYSNYHVTIVSMSIFSWGRNKFKTIVPCNDTLFSLRSQLCGGGGCDEPQWHQVLDSLDSWEIFFGYVPSAKPVFSFLTFPASL